MLPLTLYCRRGSLVAPAATLVLGLLLGGCGPTRPETVPVSGRVRLDKGDWPSAGLIVFTPVESADGRPARAGRGFFDLQGRFTVTTYAEGDGLMPGTYRAAVHCGETVRDMESPGRSYAPPRYENPAQSGLELTVPAGARPIEVEYCLSSTGADLP